MKTRLFAALATLTVVSILSTQASAGESTSWSAIKGGFSEAPKKVQISASRVSKVSLSADFSNLSIVEQVRLAKVLGYPEVPETPNPSMAWQVDFSAYVDYLAARVDFGFLVEAQTMAKDLSREVPTLLSWSQKRTLALAVGFGLIGANYDNPSATEIAALKRWNKNLYSRIGIQMSVRTLIRHTEAIADLN
jgi:hypothetical protein